MLIYHRHNTIVSSGSCGGSSKSNAKSKTLRETYKRTVDGRDLLFPNVSAVSEASNQSVANQNAARDREISQTNQRFLRGLGLSVKRRCKTGAKTTATTTTTAITN